MTDYVIRVCMGDERDPTTSWCRWGGSDGDWYRLEEQIRARGPYRFRRRGGTTAEQRAGLRADGWSWDGAAWCLPRGRR